MTFMGECALLIQLKLIGLFSRNNPDNLKIVDRKAWKDVAKPAEISSVNQVDLDSPSQTLLTLFDLI